MSNANNSMTESRIANLLSGEGSSKERVLSTAHNGAQAKLMVAVKRIQGKMSCCFFADIFKLSSPLAYIAIHYRRVSRRATKTHTKILLTGISARVLLVVSMKHKVTKKPNQSNSKNTISGLPVDAIYLNWGTTSHETFKNTLTSKVPCKWRLGNGSVLFTVTLSLL